MAIIKRVKKDGSVTYQVKVQDPDGSWYPSSSFTDLTLAEAESLRLKALRRKGTLSLSKDSKLYTLDEFWAVYQSENRQRVSLGWKKSQDQMYRDYIEPVIGNMKLASITQPLIGRVLNRMKEPEKMKDGKARSDQTILLVYNLLNALFTAAVQYYQILPTSPVNPKFHRTRPKLDEAKFLPPSSVWKILEHAKGDPYGPAVWLELLAGLRTEATCALKWDCVDLEKGEILIRRAFKQKIRRIEEYPKGRSAGRVPMIAPLREYLAELWKASPKDQDAFVARSRTGNPLKPEVFGVNLKRICREAGIMEMTSHQLRHSCSELFVDAGASGEDIRRLLNHRSTSTTMRYIHRTDVRLKGIAGKVQKPETPEKGVTFPKIFPNGKKQTYEGAPEGDQNLH